MWGSFVAGLVYWIVWMFWAVSGRSEYAGNETAGFEVAAANVFAIVIGIPATAVGLTITARENQLTLASYVRWFLAVNTPTISQGCFFTALTLMVPNAWMTLPDPWYCLIGLTVSAGVYAGMALIIGSLFIRRP